MDLHFSYYESKGYQVLNQIVDLVTDLVKEVQKIPALSSLYMFLIWMLKTV